MKRRNFLKSIIGAVSIAASLSIVLSKPKNKTVIPVFKSDHVWEGEHIIDLMNRKIDETDTFVGLDAGTWEYRGWKVTLKSENEEVERYEAIKDSQFIHCEIDVELLNLYLDGGYGTPHDYVNQELDAYIDQSDMIMRNASKPGYARDMIYGVGK